jgi:hypothetical protein
VGLPVLNGIRTDNRRDRETRLLKLRESARIFSVDVVLHGVVGWLYYAA